MTSIVKQRIEQIRRGEVPEGYKKTKAGVIPSEWELHPLSKHLTESRIPGTNGAVAKKLTVKLWNKGVFEKREVHEGSESTTYYKRKAGQLIYSKLDFLNCAFGIIPDHLNGYESTQDLPCFDINDVDPYYLLTYVTQRNFYTHFGMIADGGRKARRVGPEDMLSFPLIYPSLPEQEKIAEILSAQDKLIALKEKLIEEKKRQKKVLMQQLLTGQKRIKGFADKWKKHKLDEFIVEYNEKTTINNQYPVLTSSRQGLFFQSEYYNKEIASEDNTGYNVVPRGYFTYRHMSDDEIFKFNINTIVDKGIVSTLYPVFTTKNIDDKYLQFLLNEGIEFKKFAMLQKQGGSRTYMYLDKLKQLRVLIPSIEEQTAISSIISTSEKEIEILQKDLNQEKQKKKALMQILLTGIVRV